MVLLTLAASAVYGPAQKERDETTEQSQAMGHAASVESVVLAGSSGWVADDLPRSAIYCDGQHCGGINDPASVGLGVGIEDGRNTAPDLTAALWSTYGDLSRVPVVVVAPTVDAGREPGTARERLRGSDPQPNTAGDCYADILARYEWDVATMQAIFWRESNCLLDPPHNNPSRGICQAYGPVWQWLLDQYDWAHSPEQAIEMCRVIYERAGGISPWAVP